jgi:hypothetical protein
LELQKSSKMDATTPQSPDQLHAFQANWYAEMNFLDDVTSSQQEPVASTSGTRSPPPPPPPEVFDYSLLSDTFLVVADELDFKSRYYE